MKTMSDAKKMYKDLVGTFGKCGNLYTFEYCTNYGIELDNSTIDKIEVIGDDVRFFFNENTGDYEWIERFTLNELYHFYDELLGVILGLDEEEEEEEELTETDIADAKTIVNYYNGLDIEKMSVADALAEVVRVADKMAELLSKFTN